MKDITVVDVNEGDKQVEPVEEKPEEPNEEPKEEIREEPKEEPKEEQVEPFKTKKEYKTRQVNIERVQCPDCKTEMSKKSLKYSHICKGERKKDVDLNKPVKKRVLHPTQVEEFKEDVYEKVKDNIPKVDEQEIERRVEERLKKHLETTANKVFETVKDRYINMKQQKMEKKQEHINKLVSQIIW